MLHEHRSILDDFVDVAAEGGRALVIVWVTGERDVIALCIFLELERPRANGLRRAVFVRAEVLRRDTAEEMLGDDPVHIIDEEGCDHILEGEDNRLRVRDRD